MVYKFRYFFDPGSGVCLWSTDEYTKNKYNYPVEHSKLPISENLSRRLDYLCAWYNTSIDWHYPQDPSPWSAKERRQFEEKSVEFLDELRKTLGKDFEIVDKSKF